MTDTSFENLSPPVSIGRLLAVIRARWISVLTVMISTVALVVLVCYLLPEQYTASAVVVIDLKSPDPVSGGYSPGLMQPTYMGTQAEMLRSERVVLAALRSLHVLESSEVRAKWQEDTGGTGDLGAWAADFFSKKLDVRPGRDSNLIEVRYKWPDAKFAVDMANAIVKSYVDTSVALQAEPAKQYNELFDVRAKALRADLEAAQAKLSAYQREHRLIATDDRFDIESARLAELSSQLVTLQALSAESQNRQSKGGGRSDRQQEVLNNPLVAQLSADLARAESQLIELRARLGDKHPQVIQASAGVDEIRAKLDNTVQRVSGSLTINSDVNQARVAQVKAQLEQQRNTVLELRSVRDSAMVLQRDVENAQAAFQNAVARTQQSGLATQNTQTNIMVLKQATDTGVPSFPRWPLIIVVSELLGILFGLGFALFRERFDERLRVNEDIASLGLPIINVLPDQRREAKRPLGMRKAAAMLGYKPASA